jgi:uncharacterized protein YecE (DUF72 family)
MAELRIGTSGWLYKGWNHTFYPDTLPRRRVLAYSAECFNSVEVNGSFYSLQRPETYRSWYEQTPPNFLFAVKGSRFITHNKKLRDVEIPMANFFASGLLLLADKLGPIVWQLPAQARFDPERLAAFFALLPHDTRAAARLARRHDHRVEGRSWTRAVGLHRIRHAIEVRSDAFFVPEFTRLARRHDIALVCSDAPDWPRVEEITASFVYVRLHGAERKYASRYDDAALDAWATRIEHWQRGSEAPGARRISTAKPPRRKTRDVFVYFDNDYEANAPNDALRLATRVAPQPPPSRPSDSAVRPPLSAHAGRQPLRASRRRG